jgi:TPR repeat protein
MVSASLHLSSADEPHGLQKVKALSYDGTEESLQKIQDAVKDSALSHNLIALNIYRQTMYGLSQEALLQSTPKTSSIVMTDQRREAIKPWLDLVRAKSDAGDSFYTTVLAGLYLFGDGVDKDKAMCYKLWEKAAAAGYSDANHKMGIFWSEGMGGEVDPAKALQYYLKAAELGSALSTYNIGCLYHEGKHVKQDDKKALEYWEAAAEKGHPTAQRNVGLCYVDGVGTEINYARAKKWFEKAAASGDEGGAHLLKERFGLTQSHTESDPGRPVHSHEK